MPPQCVAHHVLHGERHAFDSAWSCYRIGDDRATDGKHTHGHGGVVAKDAHARWRAGRQFGHDGVAAAHTSARIGAATVSHRLDQPPL